MRRFSSVVVSRLFRAFDYSNDILKSTGSLLPDRMQQTMAEHDVRGEKAIAAGQAFIALLVLFLHLGAQIETQWANVNSWVIGTILALIGTSAIRACIAESRNSTEDALDCVNIVDISLFLLLIWSYQFSYSHPAAAVLKAPTFALLFAMIGLRGLRFHPRPIITAGCTAVVGWAVIVFLSVSSDGTGSITGNYSEYLASFSIMLGAEFEKIISLAMLTIFLVFAAHKARKILSKAAHADDYAEALSNIKKHLSETDSARKKAEDALTELDKREHELVAQNKQFNAALSHMSQGLCMFDENKNLLVCNDLYIEMYDLSEELGTPGTPFRKILEHRTQNGFFSREGAEEYIAERLSAVEEDQASTKIQELNNGRIIAISHRPMKDGGWVATHEDITEFQRIQAKIKHMALHDALTDLPNRSLLRERIDFSLDNCDEGEGFNVLCLDLDHFKNVNDTLGHTIGDQLLKAVTKRLQKSISEKDIIARLGGDEFAIIQKADKPAQEATALAIRICNEMKKPFMLDGHQVVAETSIGIAIAPIDGVDADQLLKNADLALYKAKADGRGCFRFFEEEMDELMRNRREMELELRDALQNGDFELYYQPLYNLNADEITGFEALLRWNHKEKGLVAPDKFIPLAEEIGLIVPIGEFVIRDACAQAAKWPDHISIAINLSPVQFKCANLVPTVVNAIASAGIAPSRLQLEITENVLLQDSQSTLGKLTQLQELGVKIAMDDFGTGYSSLSYLRSFPFDKIKIDRSFVNDLSQNDDAVAIIRAVATLGESLNMVTTAEGIETPEQLEQVRLEGCQEVQGYLFSKPKPAAEFADLFEGYAKKKAVGA